MTKSQSQISQVQWDITAEFCPQIIVIDGLIVWISKIGHSHFSLNRLWISSRIQFLPSECFCTNKHIKSIVIENKSQMKGIETKAFQRSNVKFFRIPDSLNFWVRIAFLNANYFLRLHLNQNQNCHELKSWHSIELV
jgi:hypothetical protein